MDKYYKIAADYFNTFEGRHLYPNPLSWAWLCWIASLAFAIWAYWHTAIQNAEYGTYWLMAGIIFLSFTSQSIQEHKVQKLKGTVAPDGSLLAAHVRELQRLTGHTPDEFLKVAQDLITLQQLQRSHLPRSFELAAFVSAFTLKGQRWATVLAIVSIVVSLVVGAQPDVLKGLVQVLSNDGFFHAAILVLFIFSFCLAIGLMAMHILKTVWQGACLWWAKLHPNKLGRKVHISYLLQHLIKLHDPAYRPTSPKRPIKQAIRNTRPPNGHCGKQKTPAS